MIKSLTKSLCLTTIALLSTTASALDVGERVNMRVTKVGSYTSYSANQFDLMVDFDFACPSGGRWILPTQTDASNNTDTAYNLLLSALMSGSTVNVWWHENQSPNFGGGSKNCKVTMVEMNG